ncbi:MAG TPA: PH domain-containing protein, partial [Chloroflexota bacterium]|nr:PH domain-containing protein [Chloroflexota bacterium]
LQPAEPQPEEPEEKEDPAQQPADPEVVAGGAGSFDSASDPGVTAQFAAVSRKRAAEPPRPAAEAESGPATEESSDPGAEAAPTLSPALEAEVARSTPPSFADNRGLFMPVPSAGGKVGLGATALLAVCAVAALSYAAGRPIAIDSYFGWVAGLAALLLAVAAGSLTYGWRSMRYRLEDQKLTISWLWIKETVPLGRVDGVFGGRRFGKTIDVDGLAWPGHYVGYAAAEDLGKVKFYGTSRDPSTAIVIATAKACYAITPADLDGFRSRLISRLEALTPEDMARSREPRTAMPWLFSFSILRDGMALGLLGVALLVLLVSFGYVSARFPTLPELMPLHFNFANEPDLIGPPRDAFRMPGIGAFILLVNLVVATALHRGRREASRILAGATPFIQLVMLIAILRVVH